MRRGHLRFFFLFLAMILMVGQASALVETHGSVAGTWSAENNPYIITDDIVIHAEDELEILPGVEVYIAPEAVIVVRGIISILGDPKQMIKFVSEDADQPWTGIEIVNDSNEACAIQYALFDNTLTGILVDGRSITIEGCRINALERGLGLYNLANVKVESVKIDIEGESADARAIEGAHSDLSIIDSTLDLKCNSEDDENSVSVVRLNEVNGFIFETDFLVESNCIAFALNILNGSNVELEHSTIRLQAQGSEAANPRPAALRIATSTLIVKHISVDLNSGGAPCDAIFAADRARVTLLNSIVSNTTGLAVLDHYSVFIDNLTDPSNVQVSYSCLHNMGDHNIPGAVFDRETITRRDPMWINPEAGNYYLEAESPCINTGSDIDGLDPDGTIPEMGRYPYHAQTSIPDGEPLVLPEHFHLVKAYPNPFNSTVRFGIELPNASQLRVDVFDILGRHVDTIAKGVHAGGYHTFLWDTGIARGTIASGVYLLRVETGGKALTERVVLIR